MKAIGIFFAHALPAHAQSVTVTAPWVRATAQAMGAAMPAQGHNAMHHH